jgi:histidyl-tRNA synthetase
MRDLLPAEVRRRERVLRVVREVYESYGFEPLETPAVERLDVLLGKYGAEADQLVFRILHRGEKAERALASGTATVGDLSDLALRYDLTVPLARVVAEHQGKLPRVFKRWQVAPVWRADRPGKGRYREFLQCDLDVAGSAARTVEVEVASAAAEVLRRVGFEDFSIRTNHRGVLAGMVAAAGVPPELERTAFVALDKLDKVGPDGVLRELAERGVPAAATERIAPLLASAGSNEAEVARLRALLAGHERGLAALDDLSATLALAEGSPAAPHLRIDPSLARGLDYYTGAIFEVAVPDLAGSLGSGGRYDGLVGSFLGREVPACGFSLGLERILVVLEERGLGGGAESPADVLVALFADDLRRESLALARDLRAAGLRADLHHEADKVGKQFKGADERGIPLVALVGPDESGRGTVSLKALKTGERAEVPRADAAAWLLARIPPRG